MSVLQSQSQEKRPDPGLNFNLPTNNPFRKSAVSPQMGSPTKEVRNVNNPFLDPDLVSSSPPPSPPKTVRSPPRMPPDVAMRQMNLNEPNQASSGQARAKTDGILLDDVPSVGSAGSLLLQKHGQPQSSSNRPPPGAGLRGPPRSRKPEDEKIRSPSEERRRQERRERRRKEREEGGLKDSQGRPVPSSSGRTKRRGPHLDPIDKLDTTGAFLFGGGYHVSGPYDATVARHAKSKHAPIEAFAKDSLNMVMGGGKLNYDKHVHAKASNLYGHVDDAVNDFTNSARANQPGTDPYDSTRPSNRRVESFDPNSKVDQVHGEETQGLGTSTFLEGTPAAASAIRRDSEDPDDNAGISRTRSVVRRFKSVRNRERSNSSEQVTSPEPTYHRTVSPPIGKAISAGGLEKINEKNPFFESFDEYNDEYEKKGQAIKAAGARDGGVSVTLEDKGSLPAQTAAPALTRSVTEGSSAHQRTDSTDSMEAPRQSGGFLGRMKSLRSKKREKGQE